MIENRSIGGFEEHSGHNTHNRMATLKLRLFFTLSDG
jgi:hypothetical protein